MIKFFLGFLIGAEVVSIVLVMRLKWLEKEDPCKKCALSKYTCIGCDEKNDYEKKNKRSK